MNVLYFDCMSGISGNMAIGALLELCDDQKWFYESMQALPLTHCTINISKEMRNGISGTYFDVRVDEAIPQPERHLSDIYTIIEESQIPDHAKMLAKAIFYRVAKAEAKVHNTTFENVHFHEVGAADSIIDIIGVALLINYLHPDAVYSSVVNDGYGFVECAHGIIPVPVPATSEIFASSDVIMRQIDINTELVTPTGAAIIAQLADSYGPMPAMKINKIGWGIGTKQLKIPNVLKVTLGEMAQHPDEVIIMESNVDDCTGEMLGFVMEKMMNEGARDVFFTPIFMKKNRPAYRITVVTDEEHMKRMEELLFINTTTIGFRYRKEKRHVLNREIVDVKLPEGVVKGKKVDFEQESYIYPEYESLKSLSEETRIPLKELYKRFQREV